MWWLYHTSIQLYALTARLAALFSDKARKWVQGRNDWVGHLQEALPANKPVLWFHCASLGEFEQGRPVMEALRKEYPQYALLLTFYSPSGYEIRKNYPGADTVAYLPADTTSTARRFLQIVQPRLAVFVKYEFWFGYLRELHRQQVPVLLIAARFRTGQHFFRKYGGWFRRQLQHFTHIHVQDDASAQLLRGAGYDRVTVSGDTRYDRVTENARAPAPLPETVAWLAGRPALVAGSTWPVDDPLMLPWKEKDWALIIAPHEIHEGRIREIEEKSRGGAIRYSAIQHGQVEGGKNILIIDNIGMLMAVYALGKLAYVGGAFGRGLHNILEPAAFGLPVLFGPKHDKFPEARALEAAGGGKMIRNRAEFRAAFQQFTSEKDRAAFARIFVSSRTGATAAILKTIRLFL